MCDNCYHIQGRDKRPWKCSHAMRHHYAHGLCQSCYQIKYCNVRNFLILEKGNIKD
jgi:hypothetical protein